MRRIRPAEPADLAAIASLQAESWIDSYAGILPAEYLDGRLLEDMQRHWSRLELRDEDVILLAEQAGTVLGFIAVWCRPDPFIDNLHVKPSRRSEKIGSALMQAAARQLIEMGHSSAYLWVLVKNRGAIRFYERLGGVCTTRSTESLFGHDLPAVKVEWADIRRMLTDRSPGGSVCLHEDP